MTSPNSVNDPQWGAAFTGFDGNPVYRPAPWVIDDDYHNDSGAVEAHFEAVGRDLGTRLVEQLVQSYTTTRSQPFTVASTLPALRSLLSPAVNIDIAAAYTEGLADALTEFASDVRALGADRDLSRPFPNVEALTHAERLSDALRRQLADQLDEISRLIVTDSGMDQFITEAHAARGDPRPHDSALHDSALTAAPGQGVSAPGRAEDHLRAMPMIELALAMLNRDHPKFVASVGEVQRRWNAATDQHALAWQAFGNADKLEQISASYDADAVEEARQYLAVQTLIYELWVLQEAGVEPDALWADQDAPSRVFEVLRREADSPNAHLGVDGELLGDPDPLGDGAEHLAYWVELALFGDGRTLIEDQTRLAGSMREDLLQQRFELCSQALAELEGPWSLRAFLTSSPVGKLYWQPQMPQPSDSVAGLDVALGRPGQLVTFADVRAAQRGTEARMAAEAQRVAIEDPFVVPADLDPARVPHGRLVRLVAAMKDQTGFLSAALGVQALAADHVVRVDGRPVPRDLVPWVLGLHRDAAGRFPPRFTSPVTVAGLQITFAPNPHVGVVASVDAAGTVRQFAHDTLGGILGILDQPDALTRVAKIRHGIHCLEEALTTSTSRTLRRNTQTDVLADRPGIPTTHHPTNPNRGGRAPL